MVHLQTALTVPANAALRGAAADPFSAVGWLTHAATECGGGYEGYHSYDLAGNLLAFRSPTPPTTTPGSTVSDNGQPLFGRDRSRRVGVIWWRANGTPVVYKSPDAANAPQA